MLSESSVFDITESKSKISKCDTVDKKGTKLDLIVLRDGIIKGWDKSGVGLY
jgi:hypothetical protein